MQTATKILKTVQTLQPGDDFLIPGPDGQTMAQTVAPDGDLDPAVDVRAETVLVQTRGGCPVRFLRGQVVEVTGER